MMMKLNQTRRNTVTLAAAVAVAVLSQSVAHAVPSTNACSKLTRERIATFRTAVGTPPSAAAGMGTGAIATLLNANVQGNGVGGGGGWNNTYGLRVVADRLDENAFLAPPCKSMFYPSGVVVPNNINACFRGDIAPQIELEMYWTALHGYYNKEGYPSRPAAKQAFDTIKSLLTESRSISNDAVTCLYEQVGDNERGPLFDPN